MDYSFSDIEKKWKQKWAENGIYKVTEDTTRPKFYVLDMFPYPSGAGLHVGHPLGYVASDIYARYKRLKGFNVLHPMGYDAFGLPAEQYAIETGTHPAETTEKAIKRYREQLDKIGFSFDWGRQVKTCDPGYYKWTQWIFLKLFGSWYNRDTNRAESIDTLVAIFEREGSGAGLREGVEVFTAEEWKAYNKVQRERILMHYRLAFLSYAEVNWCEALGTVLANDEVKDGKSERGGHPVERRKMRQWFLRITEYSDRLLQGLDQLDWSESMKEMQRNWIGRSEGAMVKFQILTPGPSQDLSPTLSEGEGERAPKYYTADKETWNKNIVHAKENRGVPTKAEAMVWEKLRAKRTGYKFRRQHPVDGFIPDFVCLEKGLIVEIDGKIHLQQQEQDKERTEILSKHGFEVLRFTNEEVTADINAVVEKIKSKLSVMGERKALSFGEGLGEVAKEGAGGEDHITVFTTRPDTIFGATFIVMAPKHEMVPQLTTPQQKEEVEKYLAYAWNRSDVERQQEKNVTGVFTGSYALNPFTHQPVPVWVAEYVLSGYGTGAIMAVPADDERDRKFAEKFGLPIVEVIERAPGAEMGDKAGTLINSGFLTGMEVNHAIAAIIDEIEDNDLGERKVNYKQRDAGYSRQRYWGEPFPIRYRVVGEPDTPFGEDGEGDDLPIPLCEEDLPLELPPVTSFKPTGDGRSPLANNAAWVKKNYETDTMPGYAGSSWYFLRYMDANNPNEFAAKDKLDYWQNVDVYFGGAEHAVGHLLYARMWHKVLYDLGYVPTDEPFKKLVNQGMIQGQSKMISVVYHKNEKGSLAIVPRNIKLKSVRDEVQTDAITLINFPIEYISVDGDNYYLTKESLEAAKKAYPKFKEYYIAAFEDVVDLIDNDSVIRFIEDRVDVIFMVEKMSKSKYNVVNPDDVIEKYGADCFRMFEMFLGPIEQSKPWDDKGISGVSNFLKKFWRLYTTPPKLPKGEGQGSHTSGTPGQEKSTGSPPLEGLGEAATPEELKILHKTLKKVSDDIERLNFNTCISAFMIATNELTALGCNKRQILEPLLIALAPFAPFITEELWEAMGHKQSIHLAAYPVVEEKYLVEDSFNYPVSINGKVRAQVSLSLNLEPAEVEQQVLQMEVIKKWTNGSPAKKFIYVKGKIINVVV